MSRSQPVSNPSGMMAAEIVAGAIDDWRSLIKQKAWLDANPSRFCNFDELRIFFNSEWCEFLMQNFSMQPHELLKLLEKELKEAKRKGETM
jgi:hypothetical protein